MTAQFLKKRIEKFCPEWKTIKYPMATMYRSAREEVGWKVAQVAAQDVHSLGEDYFLNTQEYNEGTAEAFLKECCYWVTEGDIADMLFYEYEMDLAYPKRWINIYEDMQEHYGSDIVDKVTEEMGIDFRDYLNITTQQVYDFIGNCIHLIIEEKDNN